MKRLVDVAGLESLDRDGLLALWAEVIRGPVPKQLSQPVLHRILAFELQARRQGGLGKGFLKCLAAAAGPEAPSGSTTAARSGAPRATARRLAPGARLMRDWNGVTHIVEVTGDGFLWRGRSYRSLSVIARTITGAHWSGPRFFGLGAAAAPDAGRAKRRAGQSPRSLRGAT